LLEELLTDTLGRFKNYNIDPKSHSLKNVIYGIAFQNNMASMNDEVVLKTLNFVASE
jgi:hypothetical protein